MAKRVKIFRTEKALEIQPERPAEVCGKVYMGREMVGSLLKHHCYCPMLLMWTTKTAVCLQTKAIFRYLYEFELMF